MPTTKHRYTITGDERVESALQRERQVQDEQERRRRTAADRLAERFRRPDGFDFPALAEASGRFVDE